MHSDHALAGGIAVVLRSRARWTSPRLLPPDPACRGAYLGTFAVAHEVRGTGLENAIIETLVTRQSSEGCRRLELVLEVDSPRAMHV